MATSDATADVIEVRPDETFDEAAIADYLQDKLDGADAPLEVRQFAGGHANLTYLLRFGAGDNAREYVLRRPPIGPVAPGSHDMRREYRALSKLWQRFPKAPRAHLLCEDEALLGVPFFVMERRKGVVVRGLVPACFGGGEDSVANRKLSEVVVDTLVEFHSVDPAEVGLGDLGRPVGFMERQVQGWTGRYERARTGDIPLAEELSKWLVNNLPEAPAPTLLHNDWRLDNMAVAADDPGNCVAVFDWDMCTRGDPLADLGTLLSVWSTAAERSAGPSSMPTHLPGFLSRSEAGKRYREGSGRDMSALSYYVVFGTFKMAVVLQQIYVRFHRGQTQDERFAGMGKAAEVLFSQAAARRP